MKETDLNAIHTEIQTQLNENPWKVLEYLSIEDATILVMNIYLTNDSQKGHGQDFINSLSVISSQTRIAVIKGKNSSFFKSDLPLCQYNQLWEDIEQILIVLDASIERMEYNEQ